MTRRNCRDKGCNCESGGKQRGGDCGCSSNRQLGGRVVNPSEYYGVDSGRYSQLNTDAPYSSQQLIQRSGAIDATNSIMNTKMIGGSSRRNSKRRISRRSKRKAPKYNPRYSNRSRYLIRSRSKKSRKSSK
jgi:hypothetical protein